MNKLEIANETEKCSCPVLICDENLYVVDLNGTAEKKKLTRYLFCNMKEHLETRDISSVNACMHRVKNNIGEKYRCTIVMPLKIKCGKYAFVCIKNWFGKYFFVFYLYKSHIDLLNNFSLSKMMIPEEAYIPKYSLIMDRTNADDTAEKINRMFASNMLINMYISATEKRIHEPFDAVEVLRRMTVDVSKRLKLSEEKVKFSFSGEGEYITSAIDITDFVNLAALVFSLMSNITANGIINVSAMGKSESASVLFTTELLKSNTVILGDFAFVLIGELYPWYDTYVSLIHYMCNLYGIRCAAELEGKNKITVEMRFDSGGTEDEMIIMNDSVITKLDKFIGEAIEFLHIMGLGE